MKIGIAIAPLFQAKHLFPTLQELLELFVSEEQGIRYFEIHTNLDILELEAFRLLKENGAKFSVHIPHAYSGTPTNFCSADKKEIKNARKWLEKSIELARELGAKNITLHPDQPKNCTKKQAEEIFKNHIKYGLEIIDKDMFLLIENMPKKEFLYHSPLTMKKIVDSFKNKQVGVTYDIGHAKVTNSEKFLDFPKILKHRIKECHFSDYIKGNGDHHPLGSGEFDFKKIIKELKKINFDGLIVMEILPKEIGEIEISRKVLEKAIKEA